MDRVLLGVIRRRKEVLAFVIGVMLFAAGAAALTRNHQRTAEGPLEGMRPQSATGASTVDGGSPRPSIGPSAGTSVGAYVDKRRAVLKRLATAEPRAASWAVVSFDAYREPEAVTTLLSTPPGRSMTVVAFQQRVPAPGLAPETVELGPRRVGAVLEAKAGAALAARLGRERSGLQRLLPSVDDPNYGRVYQAEVRRLSEAVESLRTRPATVFALVVRAPNDALARLAKLPGVRLVDVADPAPDTQGTIRGAGSGAVFGLLPDDTRTTTFGTPRPLTP